MLETEQMGQDTSERGRGEVQRMQTDHHSRGSSLLPGVKDILDVCSLISEIQKTLFKKQGINDAVTPRKGAQP